MSSIICDISLENGQIIWEKVLNEKRCRIIILRAEELNNEAVTP